MFTCWRRFAAISLWITLLTHQRCTRWNKVFWYPPLIVVIPPPLLMCYNNYNSPRSQRGYGLPDPCWDRRIYALIQTAVMRILQNTFCLNYTSWNTQNSLNILLLIFALQSIFQLQNIAKISLHQNSRITTNASCIILHNWQKATVSESAIPALPNSCSLHAPPLNVTTISGQALFYFPFYDRQPSQTSRNAES